MMTLASELFRPPNILKRYNLLDPNLLKILFYYFICLLSKVSSINDILKSENVSQKIKKNSEIIRLKYFRRSA